jgi:N6-L-threonylcarbamoyladenine synthase
MRLLVIDTSGPECAAGIYDAGTARMLSLQSETIGKGHAEILPGMVEAAARDADLPLNALDRIAVIIGPGSFTGIRVGVAMARGLALSLGIPAVGVTTLAVLAEPMLGQGNSVLALIDARREELYAGLFDHDGRARGEPLALRYDEARRLAGETGATLTGSGAAVLAGAASPQLDVIPLDVAGRIGARLPRETKASPLYIRGADAKPQTGFAVQRA